MSAERQIRELKRVLGREADLQRALLRSEWRNLSTRLAGFEETADKIKTVTPWFAAGAAVFGLLFRRAQGKRNHWISAVLEALECIRQLRSK